MVSIGELETDVRCNSPALDPIVERAISMNVPILQHTWLNAVGNGPGESTPYDVVELAKRHQEGPTSSVGIRVAIWELGIRIIRAIQKMYMPRLRGLIRHRDSPCRNGSPRTWERSASSMAA